MMAGVWNTTPGTQKDREHDADGPEALPVSNRFRSVVGRLACTASRQDTPASPRREMEKDQEMGCSIG